MTINNTINTNGNINGVVFSTTPQIYDTLALGAIYQSDLQKKGYPVGVATALTQSASNSAPALVNYKISPSSNGI